MTVAIQTAVGGEAAEPRAPLPCGVASPLVASARGPRADPRARVLDPVHRAVRTKGEGRYKGRMGAV